MRNSRRLPPSLLHRKRPKELRLSGTTYLRRVAGLKTSASKRGLTA
jgi:hypothetical protein